MKTTIVLLADIEAENFGRKCMLEANRIGDIGIPLLELNCFPSNVFGYESGGLSIRAERTPELVKMQKDLFEVLEAKLGPCPAEHDSDYMFHMTIAIGGASYEGYKKAYQVMKEYDYHKDYYFNKLGLFYYDDDNIKPGTYFCYKIAQLS